FISLTHGILSAEEKMNDCKFQSEIPQECMLHFYLYYGKAPVDETLKTVASFCHMTHQKNPTISCLTDERKMLLRRQINTRGKEFYTENVINLALLTCQFRNWRQKDGSSDRTGSRPCITLGLKAGP
uniref:Uncharacterized protein n=1 Tax=Zonotrichia albicollis TaxID=44394 RepID=A0A8D2LYU8_ZONAL